MSNIKIYTCKQRLKSQKIPTKGNTVNNSKKIKNKNQIQFITQVLSRESINRGKTEMCVIKHVTSTLQTVKAKENTRWKNCLRLQESVKMWRPKASGTLGGLLKQKTGHQWDSSKVQIKSVFLLVVLYQHSWRRQWQPTPVLLPGKSHGWRSLVGCSPWGPYESDTTERLHFHFALSRIGEGNGNPLQCSCLENLRDSRAWWGRTESDTTEMT